MAQALHRSAQHPVAAYETGQYERAKRELASALPHIEATADVQRYRVKIEAAR